MIGLLDDAISVLTETQPLPLPIPAPVLGYNPRSPTIIKQESNLPHPETSKAITNNRHQFKQISKQQQQPQQRSKIPSYATASVDRRIHLQANLAHSILSKAIDLDEKRDNDPTSLRKIIASYVEASELYLSAIQLGNQQTQKLESAAAAAAAAEAYPTKNKRLGDCLKNLLVKLKRLLGSALDRVEALKEEQEKNKRYPQHTLLTSAASVVMGSTSIFRGTPIASNRNKPLSRPNHWFSAKENHCDQNNNNQETNERVPRNYKASPLVRHRKQNPTTVMR